MAAGMGGTSAAVGLRRLRAEEQRQGAFTLVGLAKPPGIVHAAHRTDARR